MTQSNNEDGKFGGSAIFTTRNGLITSNILRNNKGDIAVKIYNHFDKEEGSNKMMILENNEVQFLISNNNFEILKESNSCLYYFLGCDASSFELRGWLHMLIILMINQSTLAFNANAMKDFLSVDLKDQIFDGDYNDEKKSLFSNWKIIVAVVVPAAFVVVLVIFLVVIYVSLLIFFSQEFAV